MSLAHVGTIYFAGRNACDKASRDEDEDSGLVLDCHQELPDTAEF